MPDQSVEQIDSLITRLERKGATIGVLVKSLDRAADQSILYAHDADRLFTPASNTKIVTSISALLQLGPDFRFHTELSYQGVLQSDGVLQGDLYLKGYGDPSIHSGPPLQVHEGVSIGEIVESLLQKNIRHIQGNLVVDETCFDDQRLGEGWASEYESEYYSAQTAALSLNRGVVQVECRAGTAVGDEIEVTVTPSTSYVKLVLQAKTVAAGEPNTLQIKRERAKNVIRITGNLPMSEAAAECITVEEPAIYAGHVLKERLEEAGISFLPESRVRTGRASAENTHLASFSSAPLHTLVTHLNKVSDNHYAEMLLKTIGAVKKGEGSAAAGLQVVRETVTELGMAGPFEQRDGSGLSVYNLFSPRQMVTVLEGMRSKKEFEPFLHSLPVAGVDGTLASRMKEESPAFQRVQAKTGTLNAVSGLSGYLATLAGETLIFSIMCNGYAGDTDDLKAVEDQICSALVEYSI
ncbi:D-alanyl-D-alanine carboxypeptidase/D-alanyl-D-alanine endopeptidase [Brevibacillus migulae]|uniref:D-alanyl-D-alanine carboxypeptidase/D-alanyl-D-alanine endopeptidase n=1 Tax=Brevibacillus migulae TaxID=1644114 RepID=UPI00106ED946|nr:D-alanyl-D-alanine carboxypeptidase/D-alanyl-D-alanine-endopeptidase [Brevibacillus migulae]